MKIFAKTVLFLLLGSYSYLASAEEGHFLPFWRAEAEAQGYELPKTYGISINHMGIRQGIDVEEISFSQLAFGSLAIPNSLFEIEVGKTRQKSNTETLRFDAWVLPFMNVYGVLAYTKGRSISDISVTSDPSKQNSFLWQLISAGIRDEPKLKNLKFRLEFEGTTYGAGTTFAGAYEDFFATFDINYTQTKFDILDGQINALTITPRIGYRFDTPAIKNFNIGTGKMNIWVGSMYQKVQQTFKGKLSDLSFPSELQQLISLANSEDKAKFKVEQHLTRPWNIVVGGSYEITKNFNITMETGFAERNHFLASLQYRF